MNNPTNIQTYHHIHGESALIMCKQIMLSLAVLAFGALLNGCESSATLDQPQIMERPANANEVQAPQLNFTKGDQTDDAELLTDLDFGEARIIEGELIKVIPLNLNTGDEVLISAWSDQNSAMFVYRPGRVSSWWTDETRRELTAEVKAGVDRVELNLSAQETGRYALVLKSLNGNSQNILTATCLAGPCQEAITAALEQTAQEEVEETLELTTEPPVE